MIWAGIKSRTWLLRMAIKGRLQRFWHPHPRLLHKTRYRPNLLRCYLRYFNSPKVYL